MKVVIRRSPPLITLRGSNYGMTRRTVALALAICAVAAVIRFVVLVAANLGDPTAPGSVMDRWHVWLGVALLSAAVAAVSWGGVQRPRKRE